MMNKNRYETSNNIYLNDQEIEVNFDRQNIWSDDNEKKSRQLKVVFDSYFSSNNFTVENIYSDSQNFGKAKNKDLSVDYYCGRNFNLHIWIGDHGGMFNYWAKQEQRLAIIYLNRFYKLIQKYTEGFEIFDCRDETAEKKKMTSEERIINFLENNRFDKPKKGFKLADLDGTTELNDWDKQVSPNALDRDEKTIYNGQIKYYRGYKGYLCKGKVYHNINNMWWVISNDKEYSNTACFELFDLTEEDKKHRKLLRGCAPIALLDKLEKDSPELILKRFLLSGLTCRKLGNALAKYFDSHCIDAYDKKQKQDDYFEIDGSSWGWSKAVYTFKKEENFISLTYRYCDYLIVYDKYGNRIFEIDRKIRHYDKEKLHDMFKNFESFFKAIDARVKKENK